MACKILLVASLFLLVLPSALALNCTKYGGDYHTLCGMINPLPFSEDYKKSIMDPALYGHFEPQNQTPNIQLNETNQHQPTLEEIYDAKIVFIGRFLLFILFNYILFSLLKKFSSIRKWLTAVF